MSDAIDIVLHAFVTAYGSAHLFSAALRLAESDAPTILTALKPFTDAAMDRLGLAFVPDEGDGPKPPDDPKPH